MIGRRYATCFRRASSGITSNHCPPVRPGRVRDSCYVRGVVVDATRVTRHAAKRRTPAPRISNEPPADNGIMTMTGSGRWLARPTRMPNTRRHAKSGPSPFLALPSLTTTCSLRAGNRQPNDVCARAGILRPCPRIWRSSGCVVESFPGPPPEVERLFAGEQVHINRTQSEEQDTPGYDTCGCGSLDADPPTGANDESQRNGKPTISGWGRCIVMKDWR